MADGSMSSGISGRKEKEKKGNVGEVKGSDERVNTRKTGNEK